MTHYSTYAANECWPQLPASASFYYPPSASQLDAAQMWRDAVAALYLNLKRDPSRVKSLWPALPAVGWRRRKKAWLSTAHFHRCLQLLALASSNTKVCSCSRPFTTENNHNNLLVAWEMTARGHGMQREDTNLIVVLHHHQRESTPFEVQPSDFGPVQHTHTHTRTDEWQTHKETNSLSGTGDESTQYETSAPRRVILDFFSLPIPRPAPWRTNTQLSVALFFPGMPFLQSLHGPHPPPRLSLCPTLCFITYATFWLALGCKCWHMPLQKHVVQKNKRNSNSISRGIAADRRSKSLNRYCFFFFFTCQKR